MNVPDLHWRSIISIVRARTEVIIRYNAFETHELRWFDREEWEDCRIIAPFVFWHGEHQGTLGTIHVSGDYAAITFQNPNEKIVYTYGDPINLRSS
jgi:hypothetical protein